MDDFGPVLEITDVNEDRYLLNPSAWRSLTLSKTSDDDDHPIQITVTWQDRSVDYLFVQRREAERVSRWGRWGGTMWQSN